MGPSDRQRAEVLFEVLLKLPASEHDEFLERECANQPELAREVRLLLAHYQAAPPGFLQGPAQGLNDAQSPESIDAYVLGEVLGEGGMGVVYRAEQREPVARTVALKVLKLGMDSKEILARFEAERQALAKLEHPNIARVYDAGTTEDGRPYFAMEYVQGQAITTYCDEHRLDPRQRIELFVELCQGVQYAHQQGIIHRDLKPMNILVEERDGVAHPKVIDFGVAKAVQQDLAGATIFTRQGQFIGTPEYMSPEQAQSAPIDTRTDVYSLGAVLYELLVGVLPLDAASLREAGLEAMMRMILEEDPPRPSTRAGTLSQSDVGVADRRNVGPRALARSLRGELDWIAMKALEKDPDRRYATVAELAADLQRHLADEPVMARPAGTWYLLKKFARRHRVGVGLVGTIAVALTVLAASMTFQARQIARERDRANHEARVAEQVTEFLVDLFVVSDPGEARGEKISAREILERGAQKVDGLADAAVRAELTQTLGAVYYNLGLYARSDSLTFRARNLWMDLEGLDHPRTLLAVTDEAGIYSALGRWAEAESTYNVALDGWRRLGQPKGRDALDASTRLAGILRRRGRYAQAESLYITTLNELRELDGEDDSGVLRVRRNLAFCYSIQERYDEAAEINIDVLERLRRVEGSDSPESLRTMKSLSRVFSGLKRFDEAEALLTEALETSRRVWGDEHPEYIATIDALAGFYFEREDHALAVPLYRDVLEARQRLLGDEHPTTILSMNNLAAAHTELGNNLEAEVLARAALEMRVRILGDEHRYTQQSRYMLAVLVARLGYYEEALEHLTIAIDHGFAHPYFLSEATQEGFGLLRGRPDFEALVATVRARLEEN